MYKVQVVTDAVSYEKVVGAKGGGTITADTTRAYVSTPTGPSEDRASESVSYTHLDVYKRQLEEAAPIGAG